MDISSIVNRLVDRCDDVAKELLPAGRMTGQEWHCSGSKSPTGYAIGVVLKGHKRGVCGFFGGPKLGGDLLDLVHEVNGGSKADAVRWAKSYLGITDDERPEQTAEARAKADEARRRREREAEADRIKRHENAANIWIEGKPISGTLAEKYLIARGLSPTKWSKTLRFIPALYNSESKTSWPALVCGVQLVDGSGTSVWRIWLNRDGNDKAPLDTPKMGLGDSKGGAVRLGKAGRVLGVAEGVETSLAVNQLLRSWGSDQVCWAGCSTSGIRGFQPPEGVEHVVVYGDHDIQRRNSQGRLIQPGVDAARELIVSLKDTHKVTIELPPIAMDWLDVLNKVSKPHAD